MKSFAWLLKVARSPVESIGFIISTGLFFYACYLLSPVYQSSYTVLAASGLQRGAEFALGFFFLLSSLPGLVSVFIPPLKKQRTLKLGTFGLFLSFLFLFILRIVVFGFLPLTWLPLLMISLTCGILRLYLEVRLN